MRRIALLIAGLLAVSSLYAQTRFGVSEADYALASLWLRTNCLAPEGRALIDQIIGRRVEMQKAFTAAIAEGPTADEVAAVRSAAVSRWRAQQAFLDDPALRDLIPPEQRNALRNQTEASYAASEVDNFVNGYRSNAMAGLALVGDEASLRRLQEAAQRGETPEAVAARGALAYREAVIPR